MEAFLDDVIRNAREGQRQVIVLPEGDDSRIVAAGRQAVDKDIADIVVLGHPDVVASHGVALDGMRIIDPETAEDSEEMAQYLASLRKHKGVTLEDARELVRDPMYYGTMMVKSRKANGMVAGACNPTPKVLRPSLQLLKTAPGVKTASSAFIVDLPDDTFGEKGRFVFADCATNEEPNSAQLADIAVTSAETFREFLGDEPRVAMLSFSTYGSAKGRMVDRVQKATALARQMAPDTIIDGDLQLDAAILPEVAASKAPESPVAGRANVLVFPDLEAGNIGYKLVERLGKAQVYGPISQGMSAPVSDLSRGCNVTDIVGVIAITVVQARHRQHHEA